MAAILLALGIFLTAVIAAVSLPARFYFHGFFAPGCVRYEAGLRPPLLPWYFKLPSQPARRKREERSAKLPENQTASGSVLDKVRSSATAAWDILAKLNRTYPEVRGAFSALLRSVEVELLRLSATVGSGDACETALLVGTLRSLAGVILSIASRRGVRFRERPRVSIMPEYGEMRASAEIHFAASVVPWRAATAALALYRQFSKASRLRWNTRA